MAQRISFKRSISEEVLSDSSESFKKQKTSIEESAEGEKLCPHQHSYQGLVGNGSENTFLVALQNMICVDEYLELVKDYLNLLKEEIFELLALSDMSLPSTKVADWIRELDWLNQSLECTIENLEIEAKTLEEMVEVVEV